MLATEENSGGRDWIRRPWSCDREGYSCTQFKSGVWVRNRAEQHIQLENEIFSGLIQKLSSLGVIMTSRWVAKVPADLQQLFSSYKISNSRLSGTIVLRLQDEASSRRLHFLQANIGGTASRQDWSRFAIAKRQQDLTEVPANTSFCFCQSATCFLQEPSQGN